MAFFINKLITYTFYMGYFVTDWGFYFDDKNVFWLIESYFQCGNPLGRLLRAHSDWMSNSLGFVFFFVLVSEAMGIAVLEETLKGNVWKVSSELGSGVLASASVLLSINWFTFILDCAWSSLLWLAFLQLQRAGFSLRGLPSLRSTSSQTGRPQ